MSRKRAIVVALAAAAFLAIQLVARPFFVDGAEASRQARINLWALNAVVLLLALATGGGLFNRRQLRALVNDDISRIHRQTATVVGYWVAMAAAMGLYALQSHLQLSACEALYLVVSSSLVAALFVFSSLEYRAHRDA
jgi:membrane protease YdiL (CAAX protease family)